MKHLLLLASMSCLVVSGCKKKEAEQKPAEPPKTAEAPKAAEPKSPCPPSYWKDPAGAFCLDIGTYKAEPPEKNEVRTDFHFAADNPQDVIDISYSNEPDLGDFDPRVSQEQDQAKANKSDSQGDLPDGKGKFVIWHRDSDQFYVAAFYIKGHKHVIQCTASAYKAPIPEKTLSVCKSLIPTD
jgi:hypothetical protein